MPKLYSAKQVIKNLKKAGFVLISQRGSHIKLKGVWNGQVRTVTVPYHKTLARGTFSSILRQAEMTRVEFDSFI